MKKVILLLVGILLLGGLVFQFSLAPKLPILNGFAAKKMCSCIFIAGHPKDKIIREDLGFSPVSLVQTKIDRKVKSVTSSLFGLGSKTAVYRNDLGCILVQGKDDYGMNLDLPKPANYKIPQLDNVQSSVTHVNYKLLKPKADSAFDANNKVINRKTLGLVIFYKDSLIYEKYAEGYDKNTPMLGWSMTKSITSTLAGILIKNSILSLQDKKLFPHWNDNRAEITLHDLLQMQSGLAFAENYTDVSDATRMLFMMEDIVKIANQQPLIHPIGSHWSYSSGTSNIISGIIRSSFKRTEDYHRFPYDSLFHRIGMNNTTMETDESGNFIGSSYCYAALKDWGRFGLLYLNEGNWFGDQVIDSSWVAYSRTPAKHSNGQYGGHFWQNHGRKSFKDCPDDLYYASGFEGQNVFIIPSYDAVIVRMGLNEDFNFNRLVTDILGTLQPVSH